jgi:hypothetical protein
MMAKYANGFEAAKESADAAARDKLTGEWYAAEIERVAKERDEAREEAVSLRAQVRANSDKADYVNQIRRAGERIATVLGDDIGLGSPLELALIVLCDRYAKARDELRRQSRGAWMRLDYYTADRLAKMVGDPLPSEHELQDLKGGE